MNDAFHLGDVKSSVTIELLSNERYAIVVVSTIIAARSGSREVVLKKRMSPIVRESNGIFAPVLSRKENVFGRVMWI